MYEQSFEDRRKELSEMKRIITKDNSRIEELNILFKRIYEDNVAGKISDAKFTLLSNDYESEQKQLKTVVEQLEAEVLKGEEVTADFERFLQLVRKYTDVDELTPTIVNEFISKIVIHAPDKTSGKRKQQIDIYYNAVGVVNILSEEELEILKAECIRDKQSQSA